MAGRVGKPHGLRGEVHVDPISDDPHRFDPGRSLIAESGAVLEVEESRPHQQHLLVKFAGIDDRTGAEAIRGALYVSADDLRDLDDDEYWQHDLVGCDVVTAADDSVVGRVVEVVPNPAHDLLRVDTPAGDRYVPVVREIVTEVDLEGRRVVVDPPAGLLD